MSKRKDDFEQIASTALARPGDTIYAPQSGGGSRRAYREYSTTNWNAIIGWGLLTVSVIVIGVVIATWKDLAVWWTAAIAIVVATGVIYLLIRLFYAWGNMHQWWRLQKAAADRAIEEIETHRQARAVGIEQAKRGLATFSFENIKVEPIPVATLKAAEVPLLESGENQPKFLDLLQTSERIALVGGSGTGKTNKLRQKVAYHLHQGHRCIVLDTDSAAGDWPSGSEVYGTGLAYSMVEEQLHAVQDLIAKRYEAIKDGQGRERQFPPVLLAADEWTMLPEEISGIQPVLKFILTKARKVNVCFVLGVHGFTVTLLGLEGEGTLRQSFTHAAFCYGTNGQNLSVAVVETSRSVKEKDAVPYELEPYLQPGQGGIVKGQVVNPEPPPKTRQQVMKERFASLPADEKQLILLTHKQGLSLNAAFQQLGRSSGRKNYEWADSVYAKLGLRRPGDGRKKTIRSIRTIRTARKKGVFRASGNSTNGTNHILTERGDKKQEEA